MALAGGLHLGLAFALLHTAWADPTHLVVGPALVDAAGYGAGGVPNGDSLQLVWFMRWTPFALAHLHDPLLTTYLNAPRGANLMWDAVMPLAAIVVAPVTLLAGPLVGFNLLATLALALCGVTATACARRFTSGTISSFAGGLTFQCSSFLVAQSQGHQSIVLAAAFAPCLLLLLLDVLREHRSTVGGGVLIGVAAAATLYTWEETLLAVAIMTAMGVVVAAAVDRRAFVRRRLRGERCLAVAGVVALTLASPGLMVQFFGPGHLVQGAARDPNVWVIDAQNIITPTSAQLLAPHAATVASHQWTGTGFERTGYLGVALLAVIVVTVIARRRSAMVLWLAAMLVAGLVLSLGPSLHVAGHDTGVPLPWQIVMRLPLAQDVLPARLAVFPALAASLLLAIAVDRLVIGRRHLAASAVAALVAASLLPAALPAQRVAVPPFFAGGLVNRIAPGTVVLVAPYASPFFPQPMIWQAVSDMRFRMPEGYVSLDGTAGHFVEFPADTATSATMNAVAAGQPSPAVDAGLRRAIRDDLRRWGVSTVIVGPMAHADAMIRVFTAVLGQQPVRVQGVAVWWHVR